MFLKPAVKRGVPVVFWKVPDEVSGKMTHFSPLLSPDLSITACNSPLNHWITCKRLLSIIESSLPSISTGGVRVTKVEVTIKSWFRLCENFHIIFASGNLKNSQKQWKIVLQVQKAERSPAVKWVFITSQVLKLQLNACSVFRKPLITYYNKSRWYAGYKMYCLH